MCVCVCVCVCEKEPFQEKFGSEYTRAQAHSYTFAHTYAHAGMGGALSRASSAVGEQMMRTAQIGLGTNIQVCHTD